MSKRRDKKLVENVKKQAKDMEGNSASLKSTADRLIRWNKERDNRLSGGTKVNSTPTYRSSTTRRQQNDKNDSSKETDWLKERSNEIIRSDSDWNARLQRLQEQKNRAERVVGTYKANKKNTASWAPNSSLNRLKKDAAAIRTSKKEKPAEEEKPTNFRDWSMAYNLMTPSSGFNKQLKTRPINEQLYWETIKEQMSQPDPTPYEQWRSAPADQKMQAFKDVTALDNARKWINANPNNGWDTLEKDRAAAQKEYDRYNEYLVKTDTSADDIKNALKSYKIREKSANGRMLERPEDYNDHPEEYDRILYDAYYGAGQHDNAMRGDRQDREIMMANLRDLWSDVDSGRVKQLYEIENGLWENKGEIARAESEMRYWEKELNQYDYEEEQKRKYLENWEKFGTGVAAFNPEYDKGGAGYTSIAELERGKQTDDVHLIYSLINGGKEMAAWAGSNPMLTSEYSYALLMTDGSEPGSYNEIGKFNELYLKDVTEGREPAEAKAFLEGLQPALKARYSNFNDVYVANAANALPFLSSIMSIGMRQVNKILTIPRTVAGMLGDESVKDPYSFWNQPTQDADTIIRTVSEKIGDPFWSKAYERGMNSINDVLTGLTATGKTKLVQTATSLFGFGLQVYNEDLSRNVKSMSYEKAQQVALVDAAQEVAQELLPLEAMFGATEMNVLKGFLVNGFANAGQELAGATVGDTLKEIFTGVSEERDRADEIFHNRYYINDNGERVDLSEDDDIALQQARERASAEKQKTTIETTAAGFTGGLLGEGYTFAAKATGTARTGSAINKENNTAEGQTGAARLINVADGMTGTQAQKMAQTMKTAIEKGNKPTNYQLGKLAEVMMDEVADDYKQTVRTTMVREVREQMVKEGIPEDIAMDAANAIINGIENNGKLTKEEMMAIAKDQRAIEVWKSFNTLGKQSALMESINKATEPQRSVADLIGDLTGRTAKGTGALAEDIDAANRESETNEEAVDNLQTRLNGILGDRYEKAVKTALQTSKTLQQSKTFLDDVVKIRLAVYSLQTAMPKTNLDSKSAQTLWNEAKAEFADEEKNRVVRQATVTPGEGTATYNGASYGTGGWAQAVNGDKTLTGRQKLYMHTVAEIAKRMGMAVHFINEAGVRRVTSKTGEVSEINMEDVYGSEDQATGAVTVNIAGLDNNRMTHNAVVTVAHEFTHWLEQNSRNGYAALRQFVFDELRMQGTDVETELIRSINIQDTVLGAESGESLDLYGAVAEVVARASEGLFTSAEMRNRLAEQDEGLYNKVKNFVRQFVARLNAAIKGIDSSLSREARALKAKVDEIAKLWLEGYEEALNRPIEGTEPAEGTRMSTADRETGSLLKEAASMAADEHPAVTVDTKNSLVTVWGKNTTTAPNTNVRYSVADNKTIRTLKMMADERILNDRTEMKKLLSKYNIKAGTGRMAESSVMDYAGTVSKADLKKLQQLQSDIERWQQRMMEYDSIDENDPVAKYMAAWNQADMEAMQEILDSTMLSTPGVIPFKAAGWYNGDAHYSYYANAIKERDPAAIMVAAAEMAEFVPDNAVLIPIPNRNGQVTESTDTMLLARAISELTGAPVVNALAGQERMSRKEAKKSGVKQTAEDLGFRKVADIPEGTVPYFIDNVVGTGVTAKAAHDAFGTGITLAYAKSTRAAIDGLKWSKNEIYGKGPMQFVRPLDQRADLSMTGVSGVRYSLQQYDQHTIDNWAKSNRIVVYTGFDSLKSFVKEALQNPTSNKSMYFGAIGPVLAEKIFLDTGIETEGLNVAIYGNEVRKIFKDHGSAAKEAMMGQLPIRDTEINDLITVISEPDKVENTGLYEGHPSLTFYKNMNGTVTAVTYTVPDKHDLKVETMWKHKNNRSLAPFNYAQRAQSPSTSGTAGGTAPSQTVPYSTIKVKLSVAQREQTYKSLNIAPDVYFKGTMEQIDAAEQAEEARAEEFRDLIESNQFMALEFVKPDGRSEILHASTRPGIKWQLSYIGSDGVPTMHENYGLLDPEAGKTQSVHTEEELYRHLVVDNLRSDLTFNVMEDIANDETDEAGRMTERQANRKLAKNGEIAYAPARYSFAGFNAASGYGSDARRAAEMAEEGATEEEIREETNCIKGYNGRWWRILDNNNMHLKYGLDIFKDGDPYLLSSIYEAEELYKAYPQLKKVFVNFKNTEEDYLGSASPSDMRITINTRYDRGIEDIEATLQHEIQHLIQHLEGSNRGASVTYWKDMQDIAKARLANNDRELTRIYDKYGIDESRELAFGIVFNEDGTLDEEWLFPEELEKVRNFSEEDLTQYRNISEDNRKWSRIVDGIGPGLLYQNTVGEIEARAASEKTGPETKIRYPENAVTTEEYSGRRFSMNQNVEVNEDGLIAYHNIAENQMLAALRLGGFPMPSIAITRTNYANNRYGGISVVFYPGTIDPGVSKWNKVYGSDAWTPTYPTVSYKLSSKAFDRLQKRIYKLVPESVRKGLQYQAFDIENLENNVNGRRGDVAAAVGDTVLFKLAYLNDKGIKYDLPQREKALDGFGNFKNDQVIRVAEVLGEDTVREAHDGGFEYIREHEELAGQVAQILNDQWREKHKDIALKIAKMDLYDKNKFGTNRIYELMEAADRYLSQGVESALDQYKMQDIADSLIDKEDYQAWLKEQTRDLIEKKGIRNNKDFYTNSGNRRSWDALHDEETLENVVKVMRAQTQKGEASMFSQSDLLAIGTKDFRTLEQIRKDKGRLMHITDEEMSELKTDIVNRVSELQDELKDRSEHNDFIARDRALQAIVSAVRRYKSAAGIESELRVWRGLHVTTGMGQRILDIMKDISELPTEYFEAKPMRAVGFEEIAEVILPEGTSQELIDGLNEKNIAWKYYDGTEEGRLKALNSVEGVQFSVRQQDMEVSRFMLGLNENNMTTAQEKTMVRQFKELDAALRIERHALNDRTRRLRELEAKQNPTAFDREEMRKLRNRIEINNKKIDRLESQMIKATSEEGYARLMYQQEQNMRNTVSGRTSEEVRATIEALTKQVAAVTKEIETRQKDIDSMRDDLTFRKTSALVDSSAAEKVAAMIRKMYNSRINKQDLIRAMTEIRLKIAAGKNIDAEAEELAWKILSDATMDGGESLKRLRGTVIKLGKGQVKELLGSNSSLKELRSIFAGSGIQVRSAKDGEVGLDGGSWEELCNIAPELDRNATELEQVNELIRFVQNQKQQMSGAEQYRDNIDEVVMDLKGWIASIGVNTPQDPGAMKILDSMNKLVNEMATGIAGSAEKLNTVRAQLAGLVDQGKLAISMTDKMQREVEQAIHYNNTLAEQSEAALWKSEKWKLIEQLKSENTQNLLKEQEKWKEKIAKDKQARQMMQSNQQLRKMIHTNITRVARLIFNETDVKNMPEHMKGLAREMLEMIMRNDVNGRKITGINRKDLLDNLRTLDIIRKQDGGLDMDDIAQIHDAEAQSVVLDALADIEDGIKYYNASTGKDIISNLQAFHNALNRIAEAVVNITNVIHAEQSINLGDRRVAITDAANEIIYDMSHSRFKGEMRGRGSKAINATKGSVVYGNTTPVYFFKNLLNRGMMKQWGELKRGQNRNGLETQKAADFIQDLANRTNYKAWADQKHTVTIGNRKLELTIGNIMEIYAIWKREQISKESYPEMSSHMEVGGIFIDEDTRTEGKLHREKQNLKAMRVNKADVDNMYGLLTAEQKQYLDEVVGYLSNQMSDLGNEASMRMYGIKKYKESWYFPMRVWDGVKSARSDKGISGTNENRAAHMGWSKRRKNNASNALVIGDFTRDAVSHIAEMINYNTMAPVIENFNKILNFQTKEIDETGVQEGDEYYVDVETPIVKRNLRIMFEEAYGKQALNYLETFLKDLNGGMIQDQRSTLRDRMISVFRKNAVAGSLSVALQQPLSYIRAAMMISPKHLAQAISPTYWKGSHAEMNKYSGVAVIKDMGRFDMNFGQDAKDYISPNTKVGKYEWISDKLTILPEWMDRMTWTRIWSAVKLEQHELHPEMDMKSDAFLNMVAERFNDVMMATQVYDSVLVKSQNMRSNKVSLKMLTSFMAEPTLTLNVLSDAVLNVKEKGGKAMLAKAGATFALGAVLQALMKGLMGSGRTPDEKKTWWENFLNKWAQNFISEIDPLNLIPGYSDLVEVLKNGELKDDAMGMLGKVKTAFVTGRNALQGKGKGAYRDIEDSAAQIAQMFTNIPYKNIMRDMRAMYNWISGSTYAPRDTSGAVIKYQTEAATMTADNMLGVLNTWMGDAGFKTTNKAYYGRMFDAVKNGNQAEAEGIREYLKLAKGIEEKNINGGVKAAAKDRLKAGQISETEYQKYMKKVDPSFKEEDLFWDTDRIKYQEETGKKVESNEKYYRLWDAMDGNKANDIGTAITLLMKHGVEAKSIKSAITNQYKAAYLDADSAGKRRIRDAIQKAYRKMGLTAEDANKVIDGWVKDSKKK